MMLMLNKLGTIKGRRKIDVSGFSLAIVSMIASFAKRNKSGNSDDEIKTLQSWTEDDDSHEKQQFVDLKQQVGRWRDRWHWWQIPALSIAIAQCLMFGLAIAPLLSKQGVSTFIFDCHFTPRVSSIRGMYLFLLTSEVVYRSVPSSQCGSKCYRAFPTLGDRRTRTGYE